MADKLCPISQTSCNEHQCRWYIQVMGKNPQTGLDVNQWGCAVEWLPVLLIENANMSRQTGAAVESFRNEMVLAQERIPLMVATDDGLTGMGMIG